MGRVIDWPVPYLGARRVFAKTVFALPVPRRPDRPRSEATTTVWADIAQSLVAVFAGRSEFEHRHSLIETANEPI